MKAPEDSKDSVPSEEPVKPKLQRSTEIDDLETMETVESIPVAHSETPASPHSLEEYDMIDEATPDVPEGRMKSFLASANHKRKHMNQQIKSQAGKLQTKLKSMKPAKSESPKRAKRKFKTPEFSKLKSIHMPKINKPEFKRPQFKKPEFKRPEMPKFKTFERIGSLKTSDFKINLPDRPKFSKPEMPKFKMPEQFSSLRLRRSKSVKSTHSESGVTGTGTEATEDQPVSPPKKRFDFSTYPRIFDRKKKPKPQVDRDDDTTDSKPQLAMATRVIRKGSPMPTGATTTSSYADTESGQFQQYSLDREGYSLDRESSLERRMRLDKQDSLNSEEPKGLQTEEQKQLADYDEENRTIHEISKLRENEFRQRKPLIHQESDLVSEESAKDYGWERNDQHQNRDRGESESLSQREDYSMEALPDRDRDRLSTQETQSSGSFKKGVIEEIDDDEFFLRKKGISQDDIQFGRYISSAIREGLEQPENSLAKLGQYDSYFDDDFDVNHDRRDYGYDVPPSKPRRVKEFKNLETDSYNDDDLSLRYTEDLPEDIEFSQPKRPTRRSRTQYSQESLEQNNEVPVAAQYYPHPDEEEFDHDHLNDFDETLIADNGRAFDKDIDIVPPVMPIAPPRAPKRRKKADRVKEQQQITDLTEPNNLMTNGHSEEVSSVQLLALIEIPLNMSAI